jgi:hypothetical protein
MIRRRRRGASGRRGESERKKKPRPGDRREGAEDGEPIGGGARGLTPHGLLARPFPR